MKPRSRVGGVHGLGIQTGVQRAVALLATPIGLVAFVLLFWFALALKFWSWTSHGGCVVGYFTTQSSQLVHPEECDWVLTDH